MVIDIALPDGPVLVVRHVNHIAGGVSLLHAHDLIIKDPEVTLEEPCRALFIYFYLWFYLWNFHQFEVYWKGGMKGKYWRVDETTCPFWAQRNMKMPFPR